MSELPQNWSAAQIGDLCDLLNGRAFKPTDWTENGLPIVRIQNLNNPSAPHNRFNGEVRERFLIDSGALLFAWSGTPGTSFGAHIWEGGPAILNQHIFNIVFPEAHLEKKYFYYAINQKLQELIDKAHGGVGLRHVTKGKFEETEIPVPPQAEQRRIVTKLDSLRSRTERAQHELDLIAKLIERYKQAILEKAFRDEEATLTPFADLIDEGPTNGFSPKASENGEGSLSLKLTATTRGFLDLSEKAVKRISEVIPEESRLWLKPGDLLIQRANSIEHLGAAAIYEGPKKTYIYPDLMMRVRIGCPHLRKMIWRYLNSRSARLYFQVNATGTAGNMPKINGATVRNLMIPLPDPDGVRRINSAIDQAMAWLDKIAAEYARAAHLVPKLDQAILSKAFRGELVHQDRSDEPASVLLERIKAEQATAEKPKRGRRARVSSSKAEVENG